MTLKSRPPDSPATRVDSLLTEVSRSLGQLAVLGLRGFDCGPEALAAIQGWERSRLLPAPDTLTRIRADLGDCRRCPLAEHRSRIVFGEGDEGARLVFVGEAPGFHEDQDLQFDDRQDVSGLRRQAAASRPKGRRRCQQYRQDQTRCALHWLDPPNFLRSTPPAGTATIGKRGAIKYKSAQA